MEILGTLLSIVSPKTFYRGKRNFPLL